MAERKNAPVIVPGSARQRGVGSTLLRRRYRSTKRSARRWRKAGA